MSASANKGDTRKNEKDKTGPTMCPLAINTSTCTFKTMFSCYCMQGLINHHT